jgi:hypothetical protein
MRHNVTLLIVSWMLASAVPLSAGTRAPRQLSCKRVREAVWAGHTLDQLTAEFDTDAQHIMKCVQSRKGKKPAAGKEKKKSVPAPKDGKKSSNRFGGPPSPRAAAKSSTERGSRAASAARE